MEDKEYLAQVGSRIRLQRKMSNNIQSDFGMCPQQFSKYEKGENTMNIITLRDICEKLQVSSDYLLGLPSRLNDNTRKEAIDLFLKLNESQQWRALGFMEALIHMHGKNKND